MIWRSVSLMDRSPFKIERKVSIFIFLHHCSDSCSLVLLYHFSDASSSLVDIIISGGENASSLAIESRLTTHPDVSEVAVVARADEKWGERPHAFVVLKNPSKWIGKSAEFEIALKEFSKPLLPGFARPAWVEIVDALEKTSTGKVSKKTLRDQLKARK